MTTLQITLLCLAIPATLFQLLKIAQISALVNHYGAVRITNGLRLMVVVTIAIQVALVLSLAGVLA